MEKCHHAHGNMPPGGGTPPYYYSAVESKFNNYSVWAGGHAAIE
jgi:hypothetical protein